MLLVTCQSMSMGSGTPPKAKTSGFTIIDLRNSKNVKQGFQIDRVKAKNLASKYFSYSKTDDYSDRGGEESRPINFTANFVSKI